MCVCVCVCVVVVVVVSLSVCVELFVRFVGFFTAFFIFC